MTEVESSSLPAARRGFTPVVWIAAIALLTVLAALIIGAVTHEKPVRAGDPVPVGTGGGTAGELQLSGFSELTGTRWSLMALGNDVSDSMFGNSYGQRQTRNLVFVDRASGESFRLLGDNTRYVEGGMMFPAAPGAARALDSRGEFEFAASAIASGDAAPPPVGWYLAEVATRPSRQGGVEVVLGSLAQRRQAVPDIGLDRIFLTASTSEAYGFLAKLLTNPGDEVLVPVPSYPLFEHLLGLESVKTEYAEKLGAKINLRTGPALTEHIAAEFERFKPMT